MSFCPPPHTQKIFKPLYKICNILIPGRAEQKNLRAGPEISARLSPLLLILKVIHLSYFITRGPIIIDRVEEMRKRTCENLCESLFYLLRTILHMVKEGVSSEVTEGPTRVARMQFQVLQHTNRRWMS